MPSGIGLKVEESTDIAGRAGRGLKAKDAGLEENYHEYSIDQVH